MKARFVHYNMGENAVREFVMVQCDLHSEPSSESLPTMWEDPTVPPALVIFHNYLFYGRSNG